MKSVRALYDSLSVEIRSSIRSRLPKKLRRWYAHKNTDVYLISYPKCGRTWLRLMIGRAISRHFLLPDDEDTLLIRWKGRPHPSVPKITVVHEDRPMLKSPAELDVSKEKFRDKRVVFLVRDPRDVIVSSYFEAINRSQLFGDNPYENRNINFNGDLSAFINKKEGGFDTILTYYNIWWNNRNAPKAFLLIRYEDMKSNPRLELRRILNFLDLQEIPDSTIADAVDFASFERMREMEAAGKFQSGVLNPGDTANQDSFKTRRGSVGGYVSYLNEREVETLTKKMAEGLPDNYGYT